MAVTIFDLFEYIKRHLRLVLVAVIITTLVGEFYVNSSQQFIATTTIKFSYAEAESGQNPKGGKLDVYEMMSPAVIERVISSLNLNMNVENIRSRIAITPLIDQATKDLQEAKTKQGETYDFFPTEYSVSFTFPGTYGADYGVKILNKLLEEYDAYFRQKYTGQSKIPDIFTNIDYSKYDYMEICNLFDDQLTQINKVLANLNTENDTFRSPKTGLTFGDLRFYFSNLKNTEYTKLYSYVRIGCLSKNKEVLLKNYRYQVEQLEIEKQKKAEESKSSYDIMLQYYTQYKQGKINNDIGEDLRQKNLTGDSYNDIIYNHNLASELTTYDEIMTRYVDTGTEAINAEKTIDYYNKLIYDFSNDTVSQESKDAYVAKVSELIPVIDSQLKEYISLANETLNDYNVYKGTQYISYLSSVSTRAKLSHAFVLAFAFALGLCAGVGIAILIEVLKKVRENSQLDARREKMAMISRGNMPKDFDSLPSLDKALFEAIADDFKEFKLFYHAICDSEHRWIGAEALVRWESKEFGMIMPNDFIPIAEKHEVMELLGQWILKEACKTCKAWSRSISPDFFISINFTLKQLSGKIFMDSILSVLDEIKVNPQNIVLEISNGGELLDEKTSAKKLSAIKTFGVRIAIDNFGGENAQFSAMADLPVDIIKIDRKQIAAVDTSESSQAFVTALVNTSDMVGIKVCAEGVERAAQAETLVDLGVSYLQGYYYSRPIAKEQFETMFLAQSKKKKEEGI